MTAVVFDDVTKQFGDTVAVDHLHLTVAPGEFLVLLGPSGCGKSTALRMIAGLDEPTSGMVLIDGVPVNGVDPRDRDVAMVFQSYALYPHMTVRKNIAFPLKPRGVTRADAARLVDAAAATLGLTDLLDRKPGQLSGGQRQRVALARAIVRRPRVFLMDEPLSNLDAKLRTQTRGDLTELHRTLGTTFVYVTHDQSEAMTMADRVAVLHAGVLQQVGPPQDVYDRPVNTFVARFLGNPPMNLLPARLDGGDLVVAGRRLTGRGLVGAAGPVGSRRVELGVRPEHVSLGHHDAPPGRAATSDAVCLDGTVELVESLGHERLVRCRVEGGSVVARVDASASAPAAGARVTLGLRPGHLHLFDADTGTRLDG